MTTYTKRAPFLECSEEFRNLKQETLDEICNGCGARDGIDVPDTMWGLVITRACNVHDLDYQMGVTAQDKDMADDRFRRNLQRLIDHAYSSAPRWQRFTGVARFLRWVRGWRAQTYYMAVHYHGSTAYWAGKE